MKYKVISSAGQVLATKTRKDVAIREAQKQDADYVEDMKGTIIWAHPEASVQVTPEPEKQPVAVDPDTGKRLYHLGQRREADKRVHTMGGRFLLADSEIGPDAPSPHGRRSDVRLRYMLGISEGAMRTLGYTQKVSTGILKDIEAGTTDPDRLREQVAEALADMADA